MKAFLTRLLRWLYVGLVGFCTAYLVFHFIRQTDWYKDHLYHQLVEGTPRQQFRAANLLAQLGSEVHLLSALKVETPAVHELAQRALEHLWFNAAGEEAFEMTEAASREAQKKNFSQSLAILDRLVARFPNYAEGWNRRASVHWQMGDYRQSLADCERALALNPRHYGAWQGIGICHLQMGRVVEACEALRQARRIVPHDASTRRLLRKCEELLRVYPHPLKQRKPMDLV
ncbi:MAG TPA: tetratricopeptide repeat protein [Methylomirabilota bacterium]|nr:tetratricopeptide repeat protein [Methylomirabilota bacterium]